jgi:hypothetical protein
MTRLRSCLGVCLLLSGFGAHAAGAVAVAPELWDRPRSARAVLDEPAVKQAVNAYLASTDARIVIHHAARQESMLQAEELRAWLVALAVEAGRITLRDGLQPAEPLRIEVVTSP